MTGCLWLIRTARRPCPDTPVETVPGDADAETLVAALSRLRARSAAAQAPVWLMLGAPARSTRRALLLSARPPATPLLRMSIAEAASRPLPKGLDLRVGPHRLTANIPADAPVDQLVNCLQAALDGALPASTTLVEDHPPGTPIALCGAAPIHPQGALTVSFGAAAPSILLEPQARPRVGPGPDRLFRITAAGHRALAAQLTAWAEAGPPDGLFPHVYAGTGAPTHRLALVAASREALDVQIERVLRWIDDDPARPRQTPTGPWLGPQPTAEPEVALLYPGQGAQYAGMLREHELHLPAVRSWLAELSRHYGDGVHPCALRHAELRSDDPAAEHALDELHAIEGGGIHALFGSVGLAHALLLAGLRPQVHCGCSNGENAALMVSGVAEFRDMTSLMRTVASIARAGRGGEVRGEIPRGATISVTCAAPDLLDSLLVEHGADLSVTASNSPCSVVLYGEPARIDAARRALGARGAIVLPLPNDRAYHTPHFAPEMQAVRAVLDRLPLGPGRARVFSCHALEDLPTDSPQRLRRLAAEQYAAPIRFRAAVESLWAQGVRVFVDVGPRGSLAAYARETLGRGRGRIVACDRVGRGGWAQMLGALAELHMAGLTLDPAAWYRPDIAALDGDGLLASLTGGAGAYEAGVEGTRHAG